MRILLLTPPFVQLNTPYPATPYLTGFLRRHGHTVSQADLSLETALAIFSREGLERLFHRLESWPDDRPELRRALDQATRYIDTIDPVIAFLQGRNSSLAHRIAFSGMLPEGPRFDMAEEDDWAFGPLGISDRARHLATLYLDDLSDLIRETVSSYFGLSRYAERLATSAVSFEPLARALSEPANFVDERIESLVIEKVRECSPELVGFTVPFPGNLYGALRAAAAIKRFDPSIRIVLGGGYVNTELRNLTEPRFFDAVDFVTLDDGERPLPCLTEFLEGKRPLDQLSRTFIRENGRVRYTDGATEVDVSFEETGPPVYDGLPLERYLSVLQVLNPAFRLWSDGRWNKLIAAHGCYWRKCAFCDVHLDYIGRYEPVSAKRLVDTMVEVMAATGESGFHFVDEAAPPLLLREMALELLERGLHLSWWTNIRFEKTFTPDLCRLLAASGAIAVSGGLEVAGDRLLKRMKKGVTVAQVARVARAFTDAGVMVHAYLMYGFPGQSAGEIIDSLETVRQLFDSGSLQSAFWHRFVPTAHSPVGREPEKYGIELLPKPEGCFALNDLEYRDPSGCDPEPFGTGLDRALHNFMLGQGLDEDVRHWFEHKVPRPSVSPDFVEQALEMDGWENSNPSQSRLVWLGAPLSAPLVRDEDEKRRDGMATAPRRQQEKQKTTGSKWNRGGGNRERKGARLWLFGEREREPVEARIELLEWLSETLNASRPRGRGGRPYLTLEQAMKSFPQGIQRDEVFFRGKAWRTVRELGLLLI